MKLLVIANPENRRVRFLEQAAQRTGWDIELVSYRSVLRAEVDIEAIATDADAIRIDSPGENYEVERLLLARGAPLAEREGSDFLTSHDATRLPEDLGRIHYPWQYYLGLVSMLGELQERLANIRWMNSAESISIMFNKAATTERMQSAHLNTPKQLGFVTTYSDLRSQMKAMQCTRVFLKLATSSSASGVTALHVQDKKLLATTTVEIVEQSHEVALYNTLRLRNLSDEDDVCRLIDLLTPHRLLAETWLPKAAYDHRSTMDMRVVTIGGKPTHFVPRVSTSPMTNLHLGNSRGDWSHIARKLGDRLPEFLETCERAAAAIPGAFVVGLDVVIDPGFRKFSILEANAFGDLLPGITDVAGEDTYTASLRAFRDLP